MKTANIFYSMGGNTALTAGRLAEALSADLIEIRPKRAYPDKGLRKFLWGGKSAVMAETPELEPYTFSAANMTGSLSVRLSGPQTSPRLCEPSSGTTWKT